MTNLPATVTMPLTKKFQAGFLVLLITDFDFLRTIVDDVQPHYFDAGHAHIKLLKIVKTQFNRHKRPLTLDIIKNIILKLQQSGSLTEPEAHGLLQIIDLGCACTVSEKDYIRASAYDFIRKQTIASAVSESINFLQSNNYDSMYNVITTAYKKTFGVGESLGIDYKQELIIDRYKEPPRLSVFSTGYPKLDHYMDGGFGKKECYSIISSTGRGKCLGHNTLIIMADGTTKYVQNVKVGDKLLGPDGGVRNVLSITSGKDNLYKVTPVKGDSYIVNSCHLLSLKPTDLSHDLLLADFKQTRIKKGHIDPIFIEAKDYVKCNKTVKHCLKAWRPLELEFPSTDTELEIPPYILGVWLGDGISAKPGITQIPNDVVSEFKNYATSIGCSVLEYVEPSKANTYTIRKGTADTNRFLDALKTLNLFKNKHIPLKYKTASIQERLELLAGLLDTDGSLKNDKSGYDFIQKNKQLAEDVVFICRSLGLAAYISECTKGIKALNFTGTYYRITIYGDCDKIPVRLAYKKAEPRKQKKDHLKTGITVEPAGYGDYYGFEIDGDRQFLLGDWQVTHNTAMLCNFAVSALRAARRVLFITLEMADRIICQRTDSIVSGFSATEIANNLEIQLKVQEKINEFTPNYYVKEFQRGQLSVPALLTYVERFSNEVWPPDVIIIDWLGCLKLDTSASDKRHEQLAAVGDEFVNLSRTFNCTVLTAQQSNRAAVSQDVFDYAAVSESFASLFGMDAVFGLGASNESKDAGKRTLSLLKNRFGSDSVYIKLRGDLPGQPLTFRFKEAPDDDDEDQQKLLGASNEE